MRRSPEHPPTMTQPGLESSPHGQTWRCFRYLGAAQGILFVSLPSLGARTSCQPLRESEGRCGCAVKYLPAAFRPLPQGVQLDTDALDVLQKCFLQAPSV